MGQITLNGDNYIVDDASLSHGYVARQSPAFRTQGAQRRLDDPSVNRFIYSDWAKKGIGVARLRRQRSGDQGDAGGMWFSTCETRFDSMITLQLLKETTTKATDLDHSVRMVNFLGDLWGVFEEDYASGEITNVKVGKATFTADPRGIAWSDEATVVTPGANAEGARAFDMWAHQGKLYLLTNQEASETTIEVHSSANGTSWSAISGTGWDAGALTTTVTRRNDSTAFSATLLSGDYMARGLSFGQYNLVATWDDTSSEIHVQNTTNGGTNWNASPSKISVPSAYGPRAFVIFKDPFTAGAPIVPVLITAEGAYKIDLTNATADMLPFGSIFTGSLADGLGTTLGGDGNLYIPVSYGDVYQVSIPAQGVINVRNVGPVSKAHGEEGDGIHSSLARGHVTTAIDVGSRWLFVGYHGASTYAILALDYNTLAWHVFFYISHAAIYWLNFAFSNVVSGITVSPRFFATLHSGTSTAVYWWDEPLVSAVAGVTQYFATSGAVLFAEDDLGDPQTFSTVLQVLINADDLTSASTGVGGDIIEFKYGVEGGDWSDNDLGDFFSDDLDLSFGSGAGIAAKTLFPRIELEQSATTTNTPKLRELEIQSENKLIGTRFWPLVIDIEATAKECPPNKVANVPIQETIIANIETIATIKTQVSFQFAESISAINVKVPNTSPPVFRLKSVGNTQGNLGWRTGSCEIRVEEGIG
jgi:hypothetical protein